MSKCHISLISIAFVFGCHSLRNSPSQVKLECGKNLPSYSAPYARIVDDQDNTLTNLTLKAAIFHAQTQTFEPLTLSEKACINLPEHLPQSDRIVVTTIGEDRYSGKLINLNEALSSNRIQLQNYARNIARVECSQPIISSTRINIPVKFSLQGISENYQFMAEVEDQQFLLSPLNDLKTSLSLNYQHDLINIQDGPYKIKVKAIDILRSLREEQGSTELTQCLVLIDSKPPQLRNSQLADFQRASPSQTLEIAFEDQTEITVFTCLAEVNSSQCDKKDAFQASSKIAKIILPAQGRWRLFYYSTDQLGHTSNIFQSTFTIVNQAEVDGIKREIRLNQLLSERNPLESYKNAKNIVERFHRLSVNEEIQQIEIPLALHLIQIGSDLKETWSTVLKNFNNVLNLETKDGSYTLLKGDDQLLVVSKQQTCGKVALDQRSQVYAKLNSNRFYIYRYVSLPSTDRGYKSWIDTYAVSGCSIQRLDTHFIENGMTEGNKDKSVLPADTLFSGLRFDIAGERFLIFSPDGIYTLEGLTSEVEKISDIAIEEHQEALSYFGPVTYDLVYNENMAPTLLATKGSEVLAQESAELGVQPFDVFWFQYYDPADSQSALLAINKDCSAYLISAVGNTIQANSVQVDLPDTLKTASEPCSVRANSRPVRLSEENKILRLQSGFFAMNLTSRKLTLTKISGDQLPDFDLWLADSQQDQIMIRSNGKYQIFERQGFQLVYKKNIQLLSGNKVTFADFINTNTLLLTDGSRVSLSSDSTFFNTYKDKQYVNTSKFLAWNSKDKSFYITNDDGYVLEVDLYAKLLRQGQRRSSKSVLNDFIESDDSWLSVDNKGITNLWKIDDNNSFHEINELSKPPPALSASQNGRLHLLEPSIYYWGTPNAMTAGKLINKRFDSLWKYFPYDDMLDPTYSDKSIIVKIAGKTYILSRFRTIHNEFSNIDERLELLSLPELEPSHQLAQYLNPFNVDSFVYSEAEGELLVWSNGKSELSGFNLQRNEISKIEIKEQIKSDLDLLSLEIDPSGRRLIAIFPDRIVAYAKVDKEWRLSWELKLQELIPKLGGPVQWLPQDGGLLFSASEDKHYHLTLTGELLTLRSDVGILRLSPTGNFLLFEKSGQFRTLSLQVSLLARKLCQIVNSEVCAPL